jgi:hypothetical protein
MKILSFSEFIKLPPGTLFSYCDEGGFCEGLKRKGANIEHGVQGVKDFWECDVAPQTFDNAGPQIIDIEGRWGIFDYTMKFAVLEAADLQTLKQMLFGK